MSEKKSQVNFIYIGICIVIVVFAAWLISYWIYTINSPSYANLGDSFGALNALFSGLAFGGVVYAIILQQHSFKLQQEDLKLQRKELKNSVNAQEDQARMQAKTARLQALVTLQNHFKSEFNESKDLRGQKAAKFKNLIRARIYLSEIESIEKELNIEVSLFRNLYEQMIRVIDEDNYDEVLAYVDEALSKI